MTQLQNNGLHVTQLAKLHSVSRKLPEALTEYLEAQDALDNMEYVGINAEPYEKLVRSRNHARTALDAALTVQTPTPSAPLKGKWSLGEVDGNFCDIDHEDHGGLIRIVWRMEDDEGRNPKLEAQACAVVAALNTAALQVADTGAADLPEALRLAATLSALKALLRAEERIENSSSFADSFAQESMKLQMRDAMQAARAAIKAAEPLHDSDCSLHNEPAFPAGPCDCSVSLTAQAISAEPAGAGYAELPDDFHSHKMAWRGALVAMKGLTLTDDPDHSYWQHELRAFDRAYAEFERASHGQAPARPDLGTLNGLAKQYADSYASPHHFTLGVNGLRQIIQRALPQAAQHAPAGSAGLFIDGVNIERLVEALTFLGRRTDGQEAMAANLSEYINAVTRAVLACKELLRPSPQAADTGAAQGAGIAVVGDIARWIRKAQAELDGVETDDQNNCLKAARGALTNALKVLEAAAPQPAPPADSVTAQGAGITAVGGVMELVEQLVRAETAKTQTHEKYMGKAMPDDEYDRFAALRDERIPELRRRVQAALAAAPQPAPPADSAQEDAHALLQDVAACFTRDDDLPDNLLSRIDSVLAAHAQADSVLEDVACEAIDQALELFPFRARAQQFHINAGPAVEADGDTLFYSATKVLEFIIEIQDILIAARKQGGA